MRRALIAHPAAPPTASLRVEAEFTRLAAGLALAFFVTGETDRLLIAAPATPERTDGLWRTTCFEAFLQSVDSGPYVELNLSPSGAWAAYAFSAPREGMKAATFVRPPRIETVCTAGHFELKAELALVEPALAEQLWRVGLSAVIEETDGRKSYFALAHPSGKPDFHDSRGFVLEAPA